MITVHNIKEKPSGWCEYIGRPRTLGNPFVIGEDGTRADVIAKYRVWLWRQVSSGQGKVHHKMTLLLAEVRAGKDLKLICHCKPLACHGDVIKACLEWMLSREQGAGSGVGAGSTEREARSRESEPGSANQRRIYEPSDNDGYAV